MTLKEHRLFRRSLQALYKRGGRFQKAADRIAAALVNPSGESLLAGLTPTHHGENRIKHCVKYDLTGACRLITVSAQALLRLALLRYSPRVRQVA